MAFAALLVGGVGTDFGPDHLAAATPEPDATLKQQCIGGTAVGTGNDGLASDCALLLAAKDILAGTATLNWSANTAIADWRGVWTGGTPERVTDLRLGRAGLNGRIPAQLGGLNRLRTIYLNSNDLTGAIPTELGSLKLVTDLVLYSNGLTGTIPPQLGTIRRLEYLYLEDNSLSGAIPAELASASSLRDLRLSDNTLTGGIPVQLGTLDLLQQLQLQNNDLTGAIPTELGNLSSLRVLKLENNGLTGEIPSALGDLGDLVALSLAGNSLTGCIPLALRNMPSSDLGTLGLSYCAAPTYTLTTSAGPSGDIDPVSGEHSYSEGDSITVTATADSGYGVESWGGACSATGTASTCVLTMDADKTASVTFVRATYALEAAATGGGSVSLSGTTTHPVGSTVTLTANWPASTHSFGGWGGDCGGTAATCVLTMDSDKTVTASFASLCGNGTAVPDPAVNTDLVEDCGRLLLLKDTLAGTGTLNWMSSKPIASWTGVTVGGTPQRVTKLRLARSELTGELSGLLGSLTGLTELRLNGNSLTGRVPSSLVRLVNLTHIYLAGNTLSGCAPLPLRTVANNDVPSLGLPDCREATDVSYGEHTLGAGTYQFTLREGEPPLVFDVPSGLQLEIVGIVFSDSDEGDTTIGLILRDTSGGSWICLDVVEGSECQRRIVSGSQQAAGGRSTDAGRQSNTGTDRIEALFDRIAESLWMEAQP